MKDLRCVTMLLPLALLLVACGATSNVRQSAPPLDYTSFVERLRAAGATVEPAGDASAYPLVTPLGRMFRLNGERVEVFEYSSVLEAQADAAQISSDGTSREDPGHSVIMDFESAPSWYQAGRLIVLYVGTNSKIATLLERQLGAPFARQGRV
jgi:hypothetical protein